MNCRKSWLLSWTITTHCGIVKTDKKRRITNIDVLRQNTIYRFLSFIFRCLPPHIQVCGGGHITFSADWRWWNYAKFWNGTGCAVGTLSYRIHKGPINGKKTRCPTHWDCSQANTQTGQEQSVKLAKLLIMMKLPKEDCMEIITAIETPTEIRLFLDKLSVKNFQMSPEEVSQALYETIAETQA